MNYNYINISKLLLGLALITISFACCDKEQIQEEPAYQWNIDTHLFTGIDPVYANESYFIFPTDYQKGEMHLLRIDEKTGDTIYNKQLLGLDDNLSNSNAKAYVDVDDNELHIILSSNFYKIDIETGAVKTKYNFPNYFWRSNIQEQFIYTCSFAALDSFYFGYFDKDVGEFEMIYSRRISDGNTAIGGAAPLVQANSYYIPYYEGKTGMIDNYLIEINGDTKTEVKIDFTSDIIGGPSFDDNDNIYLYMVDKFVTYRKSDLSVLWELETVPVGSGPYVQTDNKIYIIPSRCIELCEANIMYIIDKATGEHKTIDSEASYGPLEIKGNYIYYVAGGDFFKFDMITEEFISTPEEEKSRTAYQPVWGIGENSKILFDDYGWHCFPL